MAVTHPHAAGESVNERFDNELQMLKAIYPEQIRWNSQNREVVYMSDDKSASMTLRLPDGYLVDAHPEVITASSTHGGDLRDRMQHAFFGHATAIEILDAVIEEFREIAEPTELQTAEQPSERAVEGDKQATATVVVWLHHLLNTNKRKQAASAPAIVSGYTKPGYPGVLLYTGQAAEVHAHVQELRSLNWQAFQIRLETEEHWTLPHQGVIEVESIGEIAAALKSPQREEFLAAMKIK